VALSLRAGDVSVQFGYVAGAPRLALMHAGQGELVLFLHGVGGNKSNWLCQLAQCSRHFTAVAWDARGYADSDDYDGPLRFADLCGDILRVMRHVGARRVHLVGLSMGGRIAFDFLRRHPDRVASLTVCSALHRASQMDPQTRARFLESRLQPLQSGKTVADIAPDVARSLLGPNAPGHVYEHLVQSMGSLRADSYAKALIAVSSHDQALDLTTIQTPVHVVAATDDPLVPVQALRAMAAGIPSCRLTEIADCGHLSNLERPQAFNAAVLGFLLDQRQS